MAGSPRMRQIFPRTVRRSCRAILLVHTVVSVRTGEKEYEKDNCCALRSRSMRTWITCFHAISGTVLHCWEMMRGGYIWMQGEVISGFKNTV